MKNPIGTIAACILAVGVIVVLAMADARMFKDAEISPLYKTTLDAAYSRFKKNDKRVPARPPEAQAMELANELPLAPQRARQSPRPGARPGSTPPTPRQARSTARKPGPRPRPRPAPHVQPAPQTPSKPSPHMIAGNSFASQGQHEKALAEFQKETVANPQNSLAFHRAADMLRQLGRLNESLALYRNTLKINPDYHCVHVHMGEILSILKQDKQAEAAFATATAAYKKQLAENGAHAGTARYHLAKLYLDRKTNIPEATKLLQDALTATPDQPAYLLLLARCYHAAGRTAEATATIDKAIKLDPAREQQYQSFKKYWTRSPRPGGRPNRRPAAGNPGPQPQVIRPTTTAPAE